LRNANKILLVLDTLLTPFKGAEWKVFFLSFLLALVFWVFSALNKVYTAHINYPVQFVYNHDSLMAVKDLPKEINATLSGLKSILNDKAFKSLPKELNKSLKELKKTLYSTRKVLRSYGSKSLFGDRLKDTLRQLHETGEQTQRLLRKLNHKPNSLIFGD